MPSINTSDFRKGTKVVIDGDPYEMIEVNFRKPGKGAAVYETKMRNLLNGKIIDHNYRSGDSLEGADVRRSDGTYSYRDGDDFVFMDPDFNEHRLPASNCADQMRFLKEGADISLLFFDEKLISMSPPQNVVLEVTYTEPAAKGNTATNITKPATVETGAEVQVPAFINQGDFIKIVCDDGSYSERVKM